MTWPGRQFGVVVAMAVLLASCGGESETPSMSERITGERSGEAAPAAGDDRKVEGSAEERFPEFRKFFPGEPGAIDRVEDQLLWGWDPDDAYGWRTRDGEASHTVVVDGVRQTPTPPTPDATVWLLGGSTTFGIGQRTEHTIAAELVALAAERGVALEVVNLGVSGYVNWQEATWFADRLAEGPPPDLAVFYDGANETALAIEREAYGLLDPADTYQLSMTDEQREELAAGAEARGYEPSGDLELAAEVQAAQYRRGIDLARSAAAAHDVEVLPVWQPHLYTIDPDAPLVADALELWDLTLERRDELASLSAEIAARSGVDPVDLSGSLDEVDGPVFFDISHANEFGARRQAEALIDPVLERVGEVAP
jgi:hypothetical protein